MSAEVIPHPKPGKFPGRYWLYAPNGRRGLTAVVHRAECPSCNHGAGVRRHRSLNHWRGPYPDLEEAFLAARGLTGREPHRCQLCFP